MRTKLAIAATVALVPLTTLGAPSATARDPQVLTKTEWNVVAIGDKRVDDVRRLCGCTESPTAYHFTFHGNDYKAYEYLTPVGKAFVFFRVNSTGQSIAGYQKDWCPGSTVDIPTGDCQWAWNS